MRFLVISIVLTLAILSGVGCSPLAGVAADTSVQGPVVPTRALPTVTPTSTATATATSTPDASPTPRPSATNTPTHEPTATPTHTATSSPTASATPSATPTLTPEPTPWVIAGYEVAKPISVGASRKDTITTQQPLVLYGFQGIEGQMIDVAMRRDSGDLDPFVIVVDSAGRELARNDDIESEDISAVIRGLSVPADGDYLIVASHYGQRFGASVGDFTLQVSEHDPEADAAGTFAESIAYDELRSGTITNANFEYIYVFEAQAGDLVSMQASSISGNLDPSLVLTDHLGNTLVRNDDDLANGSTDAALRNVLIPEDGHYSIIITRYQGLRGTTAGDFRLKLTLEQREADDGGRLRYGVLHPLGSGTISDEGSAYTDYFIGDQPDDANVEHEYHGLLTFVLPEASTSPEIDRAEFIPGGCSVRGAGMSEGPLVVYQDTFNLLAASTELSEIGRSAREIGRLTGCDPLDITDTVERAYLRGDDTVQLRLVLEETPENGTADAIGLSEPRLSIRFEEPPLG